MSAAGRVFGGPPTPVPAKPTAMTVARWHGRRDVRLESSPLPEPAADEALVRVLYTGLCGSDLEEYLVGPVVVAGEVVLGHEIVGTVAMAAADGSGPPVGTVVVVDVVTGCGQCFWCLQDEEGLCPRLQVTGQHVDGGLAEYVKGRAARLVVVPESLDPKHAGLAEPTAVAVRAVRKLGPITGRGALVIGGGTIGLLVAQVLRQAGAEPVVVIEPTGWRREIAEGLGLITCWASTPAERAAAVADLFPARGVDTVVECSGADGAAREAVRSARPGGAVVLLSITAEDQPFDANDAVLGEKTVYGSAAHRWDADVAPAVALLADGTVEVAPLITHTLALADAPAAFELLADRDQRALKILVDTTRPRAEDVSL